MKRKFLFLTILIVLFSACDAFESLPDSTTFWKGEYSSETDSGVWEATMVNPKKGVDSGPAKVRGTITSNKTHKEIMFVGKAWSSVIGLSVEGNLSNGSTFRGKIKDETVQGSWENSLKEIKGSFVGYQKIK